MSEIPFIKMHGIGNDFVIIDHRKQKYAFSITSIANRKTGVGCDQLIVIENPTRSDHTCIMRIYNADGSEVGACGNATRCVAHLLMQEQQIDHVQILVQDKLLSCWRVDHKTIKVDMGVPSFQWQEIPISQAVDTLHVPIGYESLSNAVAVNMGNPHVVFFADDISKINLAALGPKIEQHELFPKRVNVNVAQILSDKKISLRVWERGVGETEACGSGACATLVAAISRKYINSHEATISLFGGDLIIAWQENRVLMTGPIEEVFTGEYKI